MFNRIPGRLSVAPSLALGLQKIARTPAPRLAVGYHIVPRLPYCVPRLDLICECAIDVPQNRPGEFVAFLGLEWEHAQKQLEITLGEEWLLERLIAGGIVGERLPLSNILCDAYQRGPLPPGALIDVAC